MEISGQRGDAIRQRLDLALLSEHDLVQFPQRALQVRVERFQLNNSRERRLQAFGRFWFHAVNLSAMGPRSKPPGAAAQAI